MLGYAGCSGALLMFIADLVLYYPSRREHRTARSYFELIDAAGPRLAESSMQDISDARLMLGGVLGPLAATLYAVGFSQIYFGLQPFSRAASVATIGLVAMMVFGSVYHALFAYTGFLAKAIAGKLDGGRRGKSGGPAGGPDKSAPAVLIDLVRVHQQYLLVVYRWAALAGLVGSGAFAWCCLQPRQQTMYPTHMALLVPAMSAPIKLMLKRSGVGGLVLCGGLTNLWNLAFFAAATACAARDR